MVRIAGETWAGACPDARSDVRTAVEVAAVTTGSRLTPSPAPRPGTGLALYQVRGGARATVGWVPDSVPVRFAREAQVWLDAHPR